MQISKVLALKDTYGVDITGETVDMLQGTTHLISNERLDYYKSKPGQFKVFEGVEIVTYLLDELGVAKGLFLPDGTIIPLTIVENPIFVGPAGPAGPPGIGLLGPIGPAGIQGPLGPVGVQGPLGPQGVQGPIGVQGVQGLQGFTGPTGVQGPTGPTGPIGPQGVEGSLAFNKINRSTPPAVPAGKAGVLFVDENGVLCSVDSLGVVRELGAVNVSAPASVSSVSSPSVLEGANIVFTVTLSKASTGQSFEFALAGTAIGGTDYGVPLVLNSGVSISGTSFFVPSGVTIFTATTMTSPDVVVESPETVIFTVGGVSGTATITDTTPSVQSISSVISGDTTVYTITLDKPSVAGQLFTPVLSGI